MYGKMQESELTGITPLIVSQLLDQYLVLLILSLKAHCCVERRLQWLRAWHWAALLHPEFPQDSPSGVAVGA